MADVLLESLPAFQILWKEESNNASKGQETSVIDEETPLVGKNIGGIDSPILRGIDDYVSLTTQSLESNFSPHARPGKYYSFMAGETSSGKC